MPFFSGFPRDIGGTYRLDLTAIGATAADKAVLEGFTYPMEPFYFRQASSSEAIFVRRNHSSEGQFVPNNRVGSAPYREAPPDSGSFERQRGDGVSGYPNRGRYRQNDWRTKPFAIFSSPTKGTVLTNRFYENHIIEPYSSTNIAYNLGLRQPFRIINWLDLQTPAEGHENTGIVWVGAYTNEARTQGELAGLTLRTSVIFTNSSFPPRWTSLYMHPDWNQVVDTFIVPKVGRRILVMLEIYR